MGTRGYRVTRFRGRYYRFFNHWDSYPEGLGRQIAREIPSDPEAYQKWLEAQRQEALKWHEIVERHLCRERADHDVVGTADQNATDLENSCNEIEVVEENVIDSENDQTDKVDESPWGEGLPDFTPAFNDLWIEWVYTIDLDYELFSVDNGAHIELIRASDLVWIKALAHGPQGDRILLPDVFPQERDADLVLKLPSPSPSTLEAYENLNVNIVQAKGFDAFPPAQRQGPLVHAQIFYFFQEFHEHIFSATLLSWRPEDLPFREFAYAVLCLASTNANFSMVSMQRLSQENRVGHANLNPTEKNMTPEFLGHLGVGCHLKGLPPGSSAKGEMYWFDGVLVYLVAQIIDWPEIINAAVTSVADYCRSERPNQSINAILMSIEHVVLMRIFSDGRVERTKPLQLFDINCHSSMETNSRYNADELREMSIRKKKALERQETFEQRRKMEIRLARGDEVEDKFKELDLVCRENEERDDIDEQTCWPSIGIKMPYTKYSGPNLMALMFFLEASSRQHMPPSRTNEGVFPTELYKIILHNIKDIETQRTCMQVSRTFRDLCQQNIMIIDGAVFRPNDASRTYRHTDPSFPALRMGHVSTGRSQDVTLKRAVCLSDMEMLSVPLRETNCLGRWAVVVGSERDRRSLLSQIVIKINSTD